jgi:hypothetical protein
VAKFLPAGRQVRSVCCLVGLVVPWKQNLENLEGLEKETFEHQELPGNSTKKEALLPLRPIWLRLLNQVRTYFIDQILLSPLSEKVDTEVTNDLFYRKELAINV